MDNKPLDIMRRVWKHSGINGQVWVPHIVDIGKKGKQKFREGAAISSSKMELLQLRDSVDWYWTPAVTTGTAREAGSYPAQRVLWADCDESYDDALLTKLRPSFVWETSPGHKQAIWLMKEKINPDEYHRDGFMGMVTHALGGDRSGVDIGQLLRVPGTVHHKREPYRGKVLSSAGAVYTRGQLLTRVARGLGFSPALASELGADDPYGDRSKVLWRFARNAAEIGLDQELTFKLIRSTKWDKWRDNPARLKEDIANAYAHQPPAKEVKPELTVRSDEDDEESTSWDMDTVDKFGHVIHTPMSWVVPGIIPEAGCGLLVSAPKVGKTRIAIELALGLATGRRPLGLSVRRPTPVGFFSLEDGQYLFSKRLDSGLNMDQGRYKYHWDGHITPEMTWESPQPMSLFTNFVPIDLSSPEDKARLHETIIRYELKLVVIDTLSMAIGKADVSSSTDMYAILKDIKEIAKETKCAIMFIHHTRKRMFEKGESIQEMVLGSTALHAWSDFIMNLAPPAEDTDMLRLAVQTKMGSGQHYISQSLKIIKAPPQEETSE